MLDSKGSKDLRLKGNKVQQISFDQLDRCISQLTVILSYVEGWSYPSTSRKPIPPVIYKFSMRSGQFPTKKNLETPSNCPKVSSTGFNIASQVYTWF